MIPSVPCTLQRIKALNVVRYVGGNLVDADDNVIASGGSVTLPMTFSTATTATDPGADGIKFDNAAWASITKMYISASIGGVDMTSYLTAVGNGFTIKLTDNNKISIADITAGVDNTGWFTFDVTPSAGEVFANAATLSINIEDNNATVADGSVTNAKLADMAANTVKANPTAGSAVAQDVALTAGTVLGRAATGNITAISTAENTAADVDALLLLTPSDYTNEHITVLDPGANSGNADWDFAPWLMFSDGTKFRNANGPGLMAQLAAPIRICWPQDSLTWTAADNGSGKVRLTSSGAHNLSTSPAVGCSLVSTATQNGWTANTRHEIATIVDTTHIDLTTDYTGQTIPVFALLGATTWITDVAIPILRARSEIIVEPLWEFTASTESLRTIIALGTDEFLNINNTSTTFVGLWRETRIINKNSVSSQMAIGGKANASLGTTGTLTTGSTNTGVATTLSIKASSTTLSANQYAEISACNVSIIW